MRWDGIVIVSDYWTRVLSAGRAEAITLFPFVFLKNASAKSNGILLNHEAIHIRQAMEMLVVPFYLLYLTEFLWHFLNLRSVGEAYRQISFEKEAYRNEKNLSYLRGRKFWNFLRYL